MYSRNTIRDKLYVKAAISKYACRLNHCPCVFQPSMLGNFPGPFEEEMKGIADATGIPLGKVHFTAFKKANKILESIFIEA